MKSFETLLFVFDHIGKLLIDDQRDKAVFIACLGTNTVGIRLERRLSLIQAAVNDESTLKT